MARTILKPPRLRTVEGEMERSASWLELFYDLVFVVAVAALAGRLLQDVSWRGLGAFVGLFIALWYAWAQFTFYADRYDTDDVVYRLLAVAQMVAIALMATSISGDKADSTVAFAVAYVLARVILVIMYVRARQHVPETRELVTGYIKGFSLEAVFWLVSVFVPPVARYLLWTAGLIVGFGTPFYYRKIQAKVPLDTSHLPERFGLFTILVLGESLVAVVLGLSHEGWELWPTVAAIVGVAIATALWSLYFDNLNGTVVRRRPEQTKAWKPTAWIFSHLPLAVALTATGVALESIVQHTSGALATADRWLATGGVAAALAAMAVMHIATETTEPAADQLKARLRLAGAGLLVVLGLAGVGMPSVPIAVIILAVVGAQVVADVFINARREAAA